MKPARIDSVSAGSVAAAEDERPDAAAQLLDLGYRLAFCLTGSRERAAALLEGSLRSAGGGKLALSLGSDASAALMRRIADLHGQQARPTHTFEVKGILPSASASITGRAERPDDAPLGALRTLPLYERLAVALHCANGLCSADVAGVLGVTSTEARELLRRGRRRLSARLRRDPMTAPPTETAAAG